MWTVLKYIQYMWNSPFCILWKVCQMSELYNRSVSLSKIYIILFMIVQIYGMEVIISQTESLNWLTNFCRLLGDTMFMNCWILLCTWFAYTDPGILLHLWTLSQAKKIDLTLSNAYLLLHRIQNAYSPLAVLCLEFFHLFFISWNAKPMHVTLTIVCSYIKIPNMFSF